MIVEPVTLGPDDLVADALDLMARYRVSGVPITSPDGVLVGILTNRDLRFGARPDALIARADDEREPRHGAASARRSPRRSCCSGGTRSRSCRSSTRPGGCAA